MEYKGKHGIPGEIRKSSEAWNAGEAREVWIAGKAKCRKGNLENRGSKKSMGRLECRVSTEK